MNQLESQHTYKEIIKVIILNCSRKHGSYRNKKDDKDKKEW